jgi:hypothetical protein
MVLPLMYRRIFFLFLIIGILPFYSFAQNSTDTIITTDTVAKSQEVSKKDSLTRIANKRANRMALYSAILPGLGQVYNKKIWKVPIIYGGAGVLVYFIKTNNDYYKKYNEALAIKFDTDTTTEDIYPNYTVEDLTVRSDYYRRNRDFSIILLSVLYVLNVIDAYTDSQLMDFDVSDNLSLRTGGSLLEVNGSPVAALHLSLTFK